MWNEAGGYREGSFLVPISPRPPLPALPLTPATSGAVLPGDLWLTLRPAASPSAPSLCRQMTLEAVVPDTRSPDGWSEWGRGQLRGRSRGTRSWARRQAEGWWGALVQDQEGDTVGSWSTGGTRKHRRFPPCSPTKYKLIHRRQEAGCRSEPGEKCQFS